MPFKDPREKAAHMKEWRSEQMRLGYGKWVYARRKLRQKDAEIFKRALEQIVSPEVETLDAARVIASRTLAERQSAERLIGDWPTSRVKTRVEKQRRERRKNGGELTS